MRRYTVKGWDGVAVQSDDGEFVRWDDVEARDVERLAECVAKLDREAALTTERDALRARVAELEAPPVVPEGWEVSSRHGAWGLLDRHGYAADADETGIMNASIDDYIPWPALRALAWAIEHDQRPPHTGDGETP